VGAPVSTPRLAAAWIVVLAVGLVAFVGLNATAALTHGRGDVGDVLVSLLLGVVAIAGLRAARQLWRREPAGHRSALVFLGVTLLGAIWLAAQVPFGWLAVAVSAGLAVALVRDPPPTAG
jgi:hypothetical protein